MRDIKFRVWDKLKKVFISEEEVKEFEVWALNNTNVFEVMQYTGLKDKNGLKEIYEGDILKYNKVIAEVKWQECDNCSGFWLESKGHIHCRWSSFEVIGNIYQNKELLK